LSSDLSTADLQRRLSEADATGDFYARGYGQAPTTTLRARALDQDIAASQGAENRAERAIEDALFGEVDGTTTVGGLNAAQARRLASDADERAADLQERQLRDMDIVQLLAAQDAGFAGYTPVRNQILQALGLPTPGSSATLPPGAVPRADGTIEADGRIYRYSSDGQELIDVTPGG